MTTTLAEMLAIIGAFAKAYWFVALYGLALVGLVEAALAVREHLQVVRR